MLQILTEVKLSQRKPHECVCYYGIPIFHYRISICGHIYQSLSCVALTRVMRWRQTSEKVFLMPRVSANVEPEMIIWILCAFRSEYKQAKLVQDGILVKWKCGMQAKREKNWGSSQRERMRMTDIDKAMAETKTLENTDTLSELQCSQQKKKNFFPAVPLLLACCCG